MNYDMETISKEAAVAYSWNKRTKESREEPQPKQPKVGG
jgi:hypothetical protein